MQQECQCVNRKEKNLFGQKDFFMNTFLKVACNNIRNELAQWFDYYTGINYTRPTQIYGLLNTRCNVKCIMCDSWSQNENIELPPEVWIKALLSLKKLAGNYFINFSGGEPLLYKGLYEILKVCKHQNQV